MKVPKSVIFLMLAVMISATIVAAYGFLSKGKSVPAVYMVMHGNLYNYTEIDDFNSEQFWDNYPYWVLLSRNKRLAPGFTLYDNMGRKVTFEDLLRDGHSLFYRHQDDQVADSALHAILQLVAVSGRDVSVIMDEQLLPGVNDSIRHSIYNIEQMLPVRMDMSGLSYFFRIDSAFIINDIFVPRVETPEVTIKYLQQVR